MLKSDIPVLLIPDSLHFYALKCSKLPNITLEGPEDRHLRNSSCGGHVTPLTLQFLWGAASRGTAGGQ